MFVFLQTLIIIIHMFMSTQMEIRIKKSTTIINNDISV